MRRAIERVCERAPVSKLLKSRNSSNLKIPKINHIVEGREKNVCNKHRFPGFHTPKRNNTTLKVVSSDLQGSPSPADPYKTDI